MTTKYEFNKIYDEYYERIAQYLIRMIGPNDAEDVAQDVFHKVHQNIRKFREESKISAWIYRIATNTAIDRLRSAAHKHASKQRSIEETTSLEDQNVWTAQKPTAVDQNMIREEMSECVNEYIDNLPPDYKTVIVLSELENMSNQEIADILNISLDNVKIRLHRARAKLKEALGDGCDFYYNDQNVLACDRKPQQILLKPPG